LEKNLDVLKPPRSRLPRYAILLQGCNSTVLDCLAPPSLFPLPPLARASLTSKQQDYRACTLKRPISPNEYRLWRLEDELVIDERPAHMQFVSQTPQVRKRRPLRDRLRPSIGYHWLPVLVGDSYYDRRMHTTARQLSRAAECCYQVLGVIEQIHASLKPPEACASSLERSLQKFASRCWSGFSGSLRHARGPSDDVRDSTAYYAPSTPAACRSQAHSMKGTICYSTLKDCDESRMSESRYGSAGISFEAHLEGFWFTHQNSNS
ncbi:hypothetical protein EV121DRAFT_274839, partial [Schizophyllum commune]